jgi:hypothetical protein
MSNKIIDIPSLNAFSQVQDGTLTSQELKEIQTEVAQIIQDSSGESKKAFKELAKQIDGLSAQMITNGETSVRVRGFQTIPGVRLFASPRGYQIGGGNTPSLHDIAFAKPVDHPDECAVPTPRGAMSYVVTGENEVTKYDELPENTPVIVANNGIDDGNICITQSALDELKAK